MNNLVLTGMVIAVIAASAGASCVGFRMLSAKELSACTWGRNGDQVKTLIQTPREACEDVLVTARKVSAGSIDRNISVRANWGGE